MCCCISRSTRLFGMHSLLTYIVLQYLDNWVISHYLLENVGSIEGRVGVHHLDDAQQSKNFTFKCHRESNDIYSVNSLNFHPVHHTFATAGSDGAFNFWDKDSKQRLKAMQRCNQPIPCGAFNNDGSIYAYA
ncbi:rae1-like protein, partial [Trifolium pratense]